MEQVQKQRTTSPRTQSNSEELDAKERTEEQEELLARSDDVLDEIDAALQDLEQDLATTFVQRGGQ
jgi:ubiquitin-like protein Pup